jgi:hypothetical protein
VRLDEPHHRSPTELDKTELDKTELDKTELDKTELDKELPCFPFHPSRTCPGAACAR